MVREIETITFSTATVCDNTLAFIWTRSDDAFVFSMLASSFKADTPELYVSVIFLIFESSTCAAC